MYRHFICAIALAFSPSTGAAVGQDNSGEAAALHNRAAEYASQKQFTQAAKLYEQAQAMLEKSLGSNHATTVAGAQKYEAFRRSLMPELLDRLVTITSLSEFKIASSISQWPRSANCCRWRRYANSPMSR